MDDFVDTTGPVRALRRLRSGYARITANSGAGLYTVTELQWDGSADQDADAPGYLETATARDWKARASGQTGDRVRFWEQVRCDGLPEVVIDVGGNGAEVFADDLLKIETTAADGTRLISSADWRDRQIHYEWTVGYNHLGDAPDPAQSLMVGGAGITHHDTAYCGSSYNTAWNTLDMFVAGGGQMYFEIDGAGGNLRWRWVNASSWPGDTWYRLRAWAGAAKTDYDHTAY